MYKYVLSGPGSINIKAPVNNISDIKFKSTQYPDHIESHFEYPSGLIFDTIICPNKVEYISNKKLIVLEDFSIAFED